MHKQVIVIRADLGMSKGKLAAQACHASVISLLTAPQDDAQQWLDEGQPKIVVRAESLEQLAALGDRCAELKLPHALIRDAGRTELAQGTETALGVGPAEAGRVDKVTGALKLLA